MYCSTVEPPASDEKGKRNCTELIHELPWRDYTISFKAKVINVVDAVGTKEGMMTDDCDNNRMR